MAEVYPHPPMSTERLIEYITGERDKQQRIHDMYGRKMGNCHPVDRMNFVTKRATTAAAINKLNEAIIALQNVEN